MTDTTVQFFSESLSRMGEDKQTETETPVVKQEPRAPQTQKYRQNRRFGAVQKTECHLSDPS